MGEARVLLVEDDDTLGQFFAMVLDLLPVRYRVLGNAEGALLALQEEPADVIITDLLLPGLGGRGLIQHLNAHPELLRQARLVVMSGSIDDAVRRELQALGAWRVLSKPVTVKVLKACITEALEAGPGTQGQGTIHDAVGGSSRIPEAALSPVEQAAMNRHFAGREPLFRAYRDSCMAQLPLDIAAGDAAIAQHDTPSLQRLGHNLKTVLRSLGRDAAGDCAEELEDQASRPTQPRQLEPLWTKIRAELTLLVNPPIQR